MADSAKFIVKMQHDEDSLVALAHMQYDLFCTRNRTAQRLTEQIRASGQPFPASEYLFEEDAMRIITLPEREELDPLPYGRMLQLGEDIEAYYIFQNEYGGYRIPKAALGEREEAFRLFVQGKTGKKFLRRLTPLRRLRMWMRQRASEPEHL